MSSTHNVPNIYVLNMKRVPEDRFGWTEAFETWRQRRGVHVNWKFTPTASNQWTATVVLAGRTFDGLGVTKQEAKNNAVINIERANILY
ncbi:hypothetical protein RhiXN_02792 [Rhizoctonia solani]|uniref:Uncharacterized protein n=1 Tax=Rhizoctonia solani TaxID=456999 RepID=A0A8H8NSB3_9AGAM|nr:uncharacterized protein RhiXN_02792 [Rhizoctonia solani]QRW17868.1 hypothetical protein RhiXN_02792 [Rhizoctonia solani]